MKPIFSNRLLLLELLFVLLVGVIVACKKEQPDFNKVPQDPCACASEVSADFVIEERATHIPEEIWIETDTTLHNKNVQFRALEEDAEYTWYIGIQQFNTQVASRFFSDEWIGHDIPITLVVKKEPNSTCFPNDDGYDSITKYFHVSQYAIFHGYNENIELGTIEGTYRAYSQELGDSIDIVIDAEQYNDRYSLNIVNIDGSGVACLKTNWRTLTYWSYREIAFTQGGTFVANNICDGLYGVIKNRIDGIAEIIIKTGQYEIDGVIQEKTFHYFGRKIN